MPATGQISHQILAMRLHHGTYKGVRMWRNPLCAKDRHCDSATPKQAGERDVSETQQAEERGIPGDLRLVRAYAQMRTGCQE